MFGFNAWFKVEKTSPPPSRTLLIVSKPVFNVELV